VGAWRERWWTVDFLLVHGVEAFADTERVQDEFFHLFEALKRRGSRILLVSDRPPQTIQGIDDRLRSRFEGGLVLEVSATSVPAGADDLTLHERASDGPGSPWAEEPAEVGGGAAPPAEKAPAAATATQEAAGAAWAPSAENVVWSWPRLDDRVIEDD
jgi:hypothetical protein